VSVNNASVKNKAVAANRAAAINKATINLVLSDYLAAGGDSRRLLH
jgi:hypothetical protein